MNFELNKRQKIIIASVVVTFGLLSTQLVDFNLRFRFIAMLALLAYGLSLWALWEGITKLKAFVLLILPTLFTVGLSSFYFLMSVRWLTRLPIALIFGLSFYSLLLSQNVFNVAAIRTIPLHRAASTVTFLFTLITAFFIYNVVHAFNMLFLWNGVVVFLISFPLILQVLWAIEMEERIRAPLLLHSFILSLALGEIALVLSFWPIFPTMWSLTIASVMYLLLGLTTHFLNQRINRRVVIEYLLIGVGVFIVAFLTTSWTG